MDKSSNLLHGKLTPMTTNKATAQSSPNIAFIKYWGNRDNTYRLPSNSSISMNLDGLFTRTTVSFTASKKDSLIINSTEVTGKGLDRVSYILDLVRKMANISLISKTAGVKAGMPPVLTNSLSVMVNNM